MCCSQSSLHVPMHDPAPCLLFAMRSNARRVGPTPRVCMCTKLVEVEGLCPSTHLPECPDMAGVGQGSRVQRGAACGVRTLVLRPSTPHGH